MKVLKLASTLLLTQTIITLFIISPISAADEEAKTKEVFITPGTVKIEVKHKGEPVTLMRVQEKGQEIVPFYRPVTRGKIQPMYPFAPHQVETIGELEMMEYIKRQSEGDDSIVIIDSRTPAWVSRSGLIPGAVNIPFTKFKSSESAIEIMEDEFDVITGETFDFKDAKTLAMYCNGNWCPQSSIAIRKLLKMGYPAANLKYYRGGMQSWLGLGLTVIDVK